jgi:HEAT repeat protein
MRALVMIQPPEASAAFESGLTDPTPEVRVVASAGWMKAAAVPATAAPALVAALRDPEQQVRANAAHALARLDDLPADAVTALRECAGDPNDGLRLNAVLALRLAPPAAVADLMGHLLSDPSLRVRLVAAGAVLGANPADERAAAVVLAAADDPNPRVREAVENLRPLLPAQPAAGVAEPTPEEGSEASRPEVVTS